MDIPKNKAFENLIDQKFGRLAVIKYIGAKWPEKRTKGHQWLCGNEKKVVTYPLFGHYLI